MLSQSEKETIVSDVSSNQNALYNLLSQLIQIRSYTGEEEKIVRFIRTKMQEFEFDDVFIDSFGNIIGRIGKGPVTIFYDAHIDTVAVNDADAWPHPPFAGKMVDGKIYGRGAVDEKPAMAGYLMAGKAIRSYFKDRELPFSLFIIGSAMEEDVDGYPLFHIIENEKIRPDFVILGEPTNLSIYRGQRGRMELEIATKGKSAHGAHNEKGINAVYRMTPIISEIEKLDRRLPVRDPLGKGSITVSHIMSQSPSLCSVPDFCKIHIDRRLTLGETRESAMDELNTIIRSCGVDAEVSIPTYHGKSWTGQQFDQEAFFPTWMLEHDHPLTIAGLNTAGLVLNEAAQLGTWKFSTNGVATAGRFKIPTIGFAPGREELAHSSKEELVLADLLKAAHFYALFPFELMSILRKA
ncbi:YgeY family selenium metabolism-linked hydrolase [candidate division KSB1 bacterium]|nr:YgeY family selenium metabolism-linked hydrolase [candidate division KSB1 bacterium]